jgi:F-type H+-transporting ATPase subunit delta
VSGGFAVINPDSSLNINAVEAVPMEQLDVEAARRALADAQKRAERATSDKDKVAAEVEAEVYAAIIAA